MRKLTRVKARVSRVSHKGLGLGTGDYGLQSTVYGLRQRKLCRGVSCAEREGATRGTETSKYPEEKKTIVIPLVAASESGGA